jgi:hypothetical protein
MEPIKASGVATGIDTLLAPAVTLQAASLNFGSVPEKTTRSAKTVTLTNADTPALTISAVTLTGADPGSFIESDNCVSAEPACAQGNRRGSTAPRIDLNRNHLRKLI